MLHWLKKIVERRKTQPPQKQATAEQIRQWSLEGFSYLQIGNLRAAQNLFEKILHEQPRHADALYLSGIIANNEGRHNEARDFITRAIASDDSIGAFHLTLGNVLATLGEDDASLACYLRAATLEPDNAQAHSELGLALHKAGKFDTAITHLRTALHLTPTTVQLHYNLGAILQSLGRLDEAEHCYRDALTLDADYTEAENNLGAVLHALARPNEAIACFKHILDCNPEHAQAWSNLGGALQTARRVNEAESCLQRSICINPDDFSAYSNLALTQRELGKLGASLASSTRAIALRDSIGERVRMATLLPVIARSTEEIEQWRTHFDKEVSRLFMSGGSIDDAMHEIGACNFNLAYQPECNRALQQKTAQLYSSLCPALLFTAPHCRRIEAASGRIKVGFISKFMHQHSIGRTTRGLLANLSHELFHVTALFVPPMIDDDLSRFIRDSADDHLILPGTLEAARELIAKLELDILFYQDIGMDAYTYFLAYSRLAPVQCVSFGHPDTTGIPNMDYWVSSEHFETDQASSHYSEQLYLLRNVATLAYYYRPVLAQPAKSRADFGLAEGKHLYLCAQALFKIHPDFDVILADILRGDPLAEIVLVEARVPAWVAILRERLRETVPDASTRIRFLPGMSPDDFLALIAVCDVALDTLYFNGMNTNLEAFAVGVPVVTMPTALQRGRHTYGMYKSMGIEDCIAETPQEYVRIALRLGTDPDFRRTVSAKILARNAVLYEDMRVVREFERFFMEARQHAMQRE